MADNIFDIISNIISKENIRIGEPLKKHTTFRIGGNADYFVAPADKEQLAELISRLTSNDIKYYILGNGSNVLAPDEGYSGVIIYIGENLSKIEVRDEKYIFAEAGAMLSKTAKTALEHSLTGMEFAAGIPGSIGGAVTMNAGAYGGEIKDIILEATLCDKAGNIFKLTGDELMLSYRHSIIQERDFVVLDCLFKLEKGEEDKIRKLMSELSMKRREKQPLEYPSAGSTFKRPEGYFAGKLIDDAGL